MIKSIFHRIKSFLSGGMILGILFILGSKNIFAIDSLNEGYRVNSNTSKTIDATSLGGQCKIVTAPNLGKDYFIGTKTLAEWNSFLTYGTGLAFVLSDCDTCSMFDSFFLGVAGTNDDMGEALAEIPSSDSILTAGTFQNSNTNIFGSNFSSSGGNDIYIAKITSTGSLSSKPLQPIGGLGYEYGNAVITDSGGNIVVGGVYSSDAYLFSQYPSPSASGGGFVAKLSSTGGLIWVRDAGDGPQNTVVDIALDDSGNIFVTGNFAYSQNIFGESLAYSGDQDLYVAKLSSTGGTIWVRGAGGTREDYPYSLSVDQNGDVILAGTFQGDSDYFGINLSSTGVWQPMDIFLVKLSSTGGTMWAKQAGGEDHDVANSVTTDSSGNIIITGYYRGLTTPSTDLFGVQVSSSGALSESNFFIAKLSSTGGAIWVKTGGGEYRDEGKSVSTDTLGNVYVSGIFSTSAELFGQMYSSSAYQNVFFAKLTSTGNLEWIDIGVASDLNSAVDSYSSHIDSLGNIVLLGKYSGTGGDIFGQSVLTTKSLGEAFLVSFSSTGQVLWYRESEGAIEGEGNDITHDQSDNILITGEFIGDEGTFFDEAISSEGAYDIFLLKLNSSGQTIPFRKTPFIYTAGGTGDDRVNAIGFDNSGSYIVAGSFEGTNTSIFDTVLSSSGGSDIFLSKFLDTGEAYTIYPFDGSIGGAGYETVRAIRKDTSGNIYILGTFDDFNVSIDSNIFGAQMTSSGFTDLYLAKINSVGDLIWIKNTGSTNYDCGNGMSCNIELDQDGNIYIVMGYLADTNFFGTPYTASGSNGLIAGKLDQSGSLLWSLGGGLGSDYIYVNGSTLDSSGNLLVTGFFSGTGVDIFGDILTSSGASDVFVAKISPAGSLTWVKKTGSGGNESGNAIASDTSGNIYITGNFVGIGSNIFGTNLTSSGYTPGDGSDIFYAQLSSTGVSLGVYQIGSIGNETPQDITLDSSGSIYIGGWFGSDNLDVFGTILNSSGSYEAFLIKLTSTGSLLWAKHAGGGDFPSNIDAVSRIETDAENNVIVGGYFESYENDIFGIPISGSGDVDLFVAKLTSTGQALWAKRGGGRSYTYNGDVLSSLYVDNAGSILVGGDFENTANMFGLPVVAATQDAAPDGYVVKLNSSGEVDTSFHRDPYPIIYRAGGSGNDGATVLATDSGGNMIIGGYFAGTNTDIFGQSLTSSGLSDIFLTKLSATGVQMYFPSEDFVLVSGGTASDIAYSVDADTSGNILVTGSFRGTGASMFGSQLTSSGADDIFLAKLSPNMDLIWLKQAGGTLPDAGFSTTVDVEQNVLVSGTFQGSNTNLFGTTISNSGLTDGYLVKLSSTGNTMWVKRFGGTGGEVPHSLVTDFSGNILISGIFGNTSNIFDVVHTSSGGNDFFVAKLSSTGSIFWSKKGGGLSNDFSYANTFDSNGNALVTGIFSGSNVDIFGSGFSSYQGTYDAFITKLSSTGVTYWTKTTYGTGSEGIYGVITDSAGDIIITGTISGTGSDVFGTSYTSSGLADIFVAKLSSTGGSIWSKKAGGLGQDIVKSITLDSQGNIIITGSFYFSNVDLFGTILSSSGFNDIYIAKLSSDGNLIWVRQAGGTSFQDDGYGVVTDANDNIIVTGGYRSSMINILGKNFSNTGSDDIFMLKLDADGNFFQLEPEPFIIKSGASGEDNLTDIYTDISGNILTSGYFEGTSVDIFGRLLTSSGGKDGYLSLITSTGLLFQQPFKHIKAGSTGADYGNSIAADSENNIMIIGRFDSSPADFFGQRLFSSGSSDIFLSKLTSTGNLLWSKKAGGPGADDGSITFVDSSGSIYTAGQFQSGNTDIFGQLLSASGSWSDIFVAKLTSTGNIEWAKSGGNISNDFVSGLSVDTSNNVFIIGAFSGINTNMFGQALSSSGGNDIFLAQLSSTGNPMLLKRAGGTSDDAGTRIFINQDGTLLVGGIFQGTADIFGQSFTSSGFGDIFLAKLSSTGNLLWAKKAGGTSHDSGGIVSGDSNGNIFVYGQFQGINTDIFGTPFSSSGGTDVFLAKLTSTGDLIWLRKAGGTSYESAYSMSIDNSDAILISGTYQGSNVDLFGQPYSVSGSLDTFLAKFNYSGSLVWIKRAGNTGINTFRSITVDELDNVLVTGDFQGTNTNILGQILTSSGGSDIFVSKVNSEGESSHYFTTLTEMSFNIGGTGNDSVTSSLILSDGSLIAGGDFESTVADIFGTNYTSSGASDIFLARMGLNSFPIWTLKSGGTGEDRLTDITLDGSGYLLVSGKFSGTNTSIFGTTLSSSGGTDTFIAKIDISGVPIWVKKSGGSTDDSIESILPGVSRMFITGYYSSTGSLFDQGFSSVGQKDGFVMLLDGEGDFCTP